MADLLLDWCSHAAAEHAVMSWHYSRAMPAGKLVKVGVWEGSEFRGAVLFGRGATRELGRPYGQNQATCCELVRVALDTHDTPTTAIVAGALRMLQTQSPGLRLVISFADENQGHLGVIYQAGNWLYSGSVEQAQVRLHGKLVHKRSISSAYGTASVEWLREHVDPEAEWVMLPRKHRYLMPLDRAMRRQLEPLRLPHPRYLQQSETQ